uniref:t-SNARE coiled-coil homology domain-containing protein n=1 Tax=Kalanchoe fedtschenkoi TaxID=63787 RepID=A0A7N0V6V5_KALFE
MNDLYSNSFSRYHNDPNNHNFSSMEMGTMGLDKFFEDVEAVKEELSGVEKILQRLRQYNEKSKTLHTSNSVKELRSKMDAEVTSALKKAKLIKSRLEALDRSNAASRAMPNCGPGSSSDRTRSSVVNGLRQKLQDTMNDFLNLRQQMSAEYRETIQRRFFTVTGENPDEKTLDALIETGESETFLQKALREQGRGRVMDTIMEINERHEGVKEVERSLRELHQVFLDMGVLVQAQGEQLNDIESQVARASSFVRGGTQELYTARKLQKSTRMWMCIAFLIVFVFILIIVLIATRKK